MRVLASSKESRESRLIPQYDIIGSKFSKRIIVTEWALGKDAKRKGPPEAAGPFISDRNARQFRRSKPVIWIDWKKGVPGGRRLMSRNVASNTQLRVGGL